MATDNTGTTKPAWDETIWNHINQAVHDEAQRTLLAAKFLPIHMAPGASVVPADVANVNQQPLTVDETKMVDIVEILVEMALTQWQIEKESVLMTFENLATRATNLLSQAEDLLIFQGDQGLQDPLFTSNKVSKVSGSAGSGLIGSLPPDQIVSVSPTAIVGGKPTWGGNTLAAVAESYARLQNKGHYGPYCLILHTIPYADTYAPLPTTLITPAEPIKALVGGFYGTGTLPPLTGVLVSTGGNTMDRAVAVDNKMEFQQIKSGSHQFRGYKRAALRLKVGDARIKLQFLTELTKK